MKKKSMLALALLLCLTLTGCGAMLERSYEVSAPHVDRPATAEDPSILRVENYRELVSAVLYFVSQGEETGVIQLYDYAGDVEADLTAACLEVAAEDPLGAYYVDYIKHELVRVVSYDQATLSIRYRRTPEQVASMVNVTGTSAIRAEVRDALCGFEEEVVLRVAYLAEDQASLAALVRQVYYDTPTAAFGFPQVEINLYPDSGRQRVVEILLTYPESVEELRAKAADLSHMVEDIVESYWDLEPNQILPEGVKALTERVTYDPEGPANAYNALTEGRANSEGMALTYILLCGRAFWVRGWDCDIVEGTWEEEPWFWNVIRPASAGESTRYTDPSHFGRNAGQLFTAQEMFEAGYRWPGGPEETPPEEEIAPEEQETENPPET